MKNLAAMPMASLLQAHPCVADFVAALNLPAADARPLGQWLDGLAEIGRAHV